MIFQVFQLAFGIVVVSVGFLDGSGFQLASAIFRVFQLAGAIFRVFSWLLGLFGFSVAWCDFQVFSLLLGWFGFLVGFWDCSNFQFALWNF